jgi:hypothetical protein
MRSLLIIVVAVSFPLLAYEHSITVQPDYSGIQFCRDGDFSRIELPGSYSLGMEGEPDLPFLPVRVALPSGTRAVSMELADCQYRELTSVERVVPVIWQVCGMEDTAAEPEPDGGIYSLSEPFPEGNLQEWGSGTLWGYPIAVCWLRPVQWNPATGEIRVLKSAELRITVENDRGIPVHARTGWSEETSGDIVRSLVANPMDVGSSGAALVAPRQLDFGQYVIVTVPEYEEAMRELADWKTAKGIPSEVYTTDWIAAQYPGVDLQQSIRGFLGDCMSQGTDYVLLAGDNDVLEARFAWPSDGYGMPMPTDLYFADVDEEMPGMDSWDSNLNGLWGEPEDDLDWHPDLWVGRASVNSVEEAELFVDKVLLYEHAPEPFMGDQPGPSGWETSIGYTTGYMAPGGSNPGSIFADTISAMAPSSWDESKCYESLGTNSTAITIAMIDQGRGNVFHANHGAETGMYTAYGDMFTVDDIMELRNMTDAGAVTIWNSIACSLGAFDTLTCCADAWLNAPDGGGFGIFNARPMYASISMDICVGFYDTYFNQPSPHLGIAHGMSLDMLCQPPVYQGQFLMGNNLFGDPELPLWISPAGPLSVEHPAYVDGEGLIEVNVADLNGTGVENARVCLQQGDWKTGAVYEVAYTDAGGNVSISVDPQTPGEISVTAWAQDRYPYAGTITAGYSLPSEGGALFQVRSTPSSSPVVFLAMSEAAAVELSIFDLSGRMVDTPFDQTMEAGSYQHTVEGLCSGLYFARLETGGETSVRQFLVISGTE